MTTYFLDQEDFIYFVQEEHAYLRKYVSDVMGTSEKDIFVKNIRLEYDPFRSAYLMSYTSNKWAGTIGPEFHNSISRNVDDVIVNLQSKNLPTTKAIVDYIKSGGGSGAIRDVQMDGASIVDDAGIASIPYADEHGYGVVIIGKSKGDAFDGYLGNWIYEHFNSETGNPAKADTASYIVDALGHKLSYEDLAINKLVARRGITTNPEKEILLDDTVVGTAILTSIADIPSDNAEIRINQSVSDCLYLHTIPDEGFKIHAVIRNSSTGNIRITVPKGNIYGNQYENLGEDVVTVLPNRWAEMFAVTIKGKVYIKVVIPDGSAVISKYLIFEE